MGKFHVATALKGLGLQTITSACLKKSANTHMSEPGREPTQAFR